jgi:hypothetical protein
MLSPAYFLIYLLLIIVLHFVLAFAKLIYTPYNNPGALLIGVGIYNMQVAIGFGMAKRILVEVER